MESIQMVMDQVQSGTKDEHTAWSHYKFGVENNLALNGLDLIKRGTSKKSKSTFSKCRKQGG